MTILRSRLFWIAVVVVVIAALLPFWLSAYLLGILTAAYYFGVFAMAWDLLFGFAGEVNFGPTFLIGLGAYTAAILNANYGVPIPLCVIAAALAAVVGGILLAGPGLAPARTLFRAGHACRGPVAAELRCHLRRRDRWRNRHDRAGRALDRRRR